jgi:thioredoxin reductase
MYSSQRVTQILEGPPQQGETDYVGWACVWKTAVSTNWPCCTGALGCELHLEPVADLGLKRDEDGYILTDINQETNVKGIYAAGDLTSQINQISVAFGQATIAAVRIHNALDDEE